MRCYKCNSVLSENDFCNSCGADVAVYKKVVKLSNAYYNMGLAKAQIRDLTGASELLRRSVRFDKRNINARNLLGLVYYEMGEAVQAFSEWVISKNIQPEKNVADNYIKILQSNPNRLDTINQTIKKYNVALQYAKQGSDDLAVIQLKKVLNINPNLIKGHLLLALLYMKKGEYERAKKPIMKALKIDASNTLAKKYLKEINLQTDSKKSVLETNQTKETRLPAKRNIFNEQSEKEFLSAHDVIIPDRKGKYRESNFGMLTVINVIIGLVIGVAMTFFLLIPAKEKSMNSKHNKEVLSLNSQIEQLNQDKNDLSNKISTLENDKSDLSGQLDSKGNENSAVISDYDNLLTAVNYYNTSDFVNCATSLNNIVNTERSETFKDLYDTIRPEAYKQAASKYYDAGKNEYHSAESIETYGQAINDLAACFNYDFTQINYTDAVDKLGSAYEKQYDLALQTQPQTAASYKDAALMQLNSLISNTFANTEGISETATQNAQKYIDAITSK